MVQYFQCHLVDKKGTKTDFYCTILTKFGNNGQIFEVQGVKTTVSTSLIREEHL